MKRNAEFSPCKTYRFSLQRIWEERKPAVLFIGLNPSYANDVRDDHTIKRCISFAKQWGFGRLLVGNLFALITDKPYELKQSYTPIGDSNDSYLLRLADEAQQIILCWGNNGRYQNRDQEVLRLLKNRTVKLYHLGLTKHGCPHHPLYLPTSTLRIPW